MSKEKFITFSRFFPSHHPRKGEPTDFIGKIWASLLAIDYDLYSDYLYPDGRPDFNLSAGEYIKQFGDKQKHHTIRIGEKWKPGDIMRPTYWNGRPYHTGKTQFAPGIPIKKVWNFELKKIYTGIVGQYIMYVDGKRFAEEKDVIELIKNDGLDFKDFCDWFGLNKNRKKDVYFTGQIICWNENINY